MVGTRPGTTGPPKGTVLTHGNLEWTISAVESMVGLSPDDRLLSYLPLSHIAERIVSHIGQIVSGGETWFAQSLATVPDDLKACRPTIFFAVPRVWQKFHDAILDKPLHWEQGYLHAPTEPGLGIELDEETVLAHPYTTGGRLHLEMCQVALDSANAKTIREIEGG